MITDVHHVGIAVRSLDRALAFYRDALRLDVVKEGEVPARGVKAAMLAAGGSYLELIEPVAEGSPFEQFVEAHGEGLHHVALWSDCVEAQVGRLREKSVPLADEEPREGFTGRLSYLQPEAFDGALVEVVEPEEGLRGHPPNDGPAVSRIDHVVLRTPDVPALSRRMDDLFAVPTKRTFERGTQAFAFLRPGDVIIEVIGPREGGAPGSGKIAGLAFEVHGLDGLVESLKALEYPVGEPHPALQGGRIVSVHASGACGVPVAFIDFAGSPGPPRH
jgi:methylmalonyl-CoA/ethylmalonyl-CoA epimerase